MIKVQSLKKAVPNGCISLGLGQARPVRPAGGEHPAAPQGEARAGAERRGAERAARASRGGPETSEHDSVDCHQGEALISDFFLFFFFFQGK